MLTVSPQPPIATYEQRHVPTAATYTKAALRAAVDEVERAHPQVTYFPGYEIVAGSFSRGMYFESVLRSVNPAGVARVMRLFFQRYTRSGERAQAVESLMIDEIRASVDVLCDEDRLGAARLSLDDGGPVSDRRSLARRAVECVQGRHGNQSVLGVAEIGMPVEHTAQEVVPFEGP